MLLALVIASLAPFVNKAFSVDSTLFLYCAGQVLSDPTDAFGRQVNWYGFEQPLSEVTKNPPLQCYNLALSAGLFGFNERPIHALMIPWALLLAICVLLLAQALSPRPLLAAMLIWATPLALVSSTEIMCDVPMAALLTLAVLLASRARRSENASLALAAGAVAGMAALTKYFALCLVPLLLVYLFTGKRRWRLIVMFTLPVLLIVGAYELICQRYYDYSLLLDAGDYALESHATAGLAFPLLMIQGLAYLGGVCLPLIFLLPFAETRDGSRKWAIGLAILAAIVAAVDVYWPLVRPQAQSPLFTAHLAVFAAAGAYLIGAVIRDLWRGRDGDALLLALWFAGTLIFTVCFNWTISARNFLPLVVPLAIVISRRIGNLQRGLLPRAVWWAWAAGWLFSLWVAIGDQQWADTQRAAVREIASAARDHQQQRVWFLGHWGFQWYMESLGARPVDTEKHEVLPGDWIVRPSNNTNVKNVVLDQETFPTLLTLTLAVPGNLSTMSVERGAGFYSTVWGPLPYLVGPAPEERYEIRLAGGARRAEELR